MDDGSSQLAGRIEHDGYAIIPEVIDRDEAAALIAAVERGLGTPDVESGVLQRDREVYGARDLLAKVPEVLRLAEDPRVRRLITSILGHGAFPVRGLFFDKTPTANWNLPWHQDVTIAVKERRIVPGFGPWTRKGGIDHAHAPAELLERMVTLRLHLDDCGLESGPMRVLPRSHSSGRLSPEELNSWIARSAELAVSCLVPAGGAVLMRPLILHASTAATGAGHRRVIHLEYAADELPGGLAWKAAPFRESD
jgi:ectoine hydroxylase-related dioxygenase (phytanoyl-CoA dioxygenase family)